MHSCGLSALLLLGADLMLTCRIQRCWHRGGAWDLHALQQLLQAALASTSVEASGPEDWAAFQRYPVCQSRLDQPAITLIASAEETQLSTLLTSCHPFYQAYSRYPFVFDKAVHSSIAKLLPVLLRVMREPFRSAPVSSQPLSQAQMISYYCYASDLYSCWGIPCGRFAAEIDFGYHTSSSDLYRASSRKALELEVHLFSPLSFAQLVM